MRKGCLIGEKGFSLIEILIGLAVSLFVAAAGYSIFLAADRLYNINDDLSEAQQNARVAIDRLSRDIRMAGFGLPDPPFSLGFDSNGDSADDLYLSAPVTFTNSTTGPDSITLLGLGYETATLVGASSGENVQGNTYICIDDDSDFTGITASTLNNRRHISINGMLYRIVTAVPGTTCGAGAGKRLDLNSALDRNYPDGTPVYIIQAVTYSIATDLTGCSATYPCLAAEDLTRLRGNGRQVVATGIEDIQFAYGVDSDGDKVIESGEFLNSPSTPSDIRVVRVNVIGKTRNEDPSGVKTYRRPALEDHPQGGLDGYRRRVLTKLIKLRNPRVEE